MKNVEDRNVSKRVFTIELQSRVDDWLCGVLKRSMMQRTEMCRIEGLSRMGFDGAFRAANRGATHAPDRPIANKLCSTNVGGVVGGWFSRH